MMQQNLTIRLWISKDTFLPVKQRLQMTVEITAEDMGELVPEGEEFETVVGIAVARLGPEGWGPVPTGEGFEMTIVTDMTTYYFDYNEPVTIELPHEAADAIRLEEMFLDEPVMPPMPVEEKGFGAPAAP